MPQTLTNFKSVKKGQRFTVISNSNGHSYPLNTYLVFKRDCTSNATSLNDMAEGMVGNTLEARDVILVRETVEFLKVDLKKAQDDVRDIEEKIAFCERLGIPEYSEEAKIAHKVLRTMKNLKTDNDKLDLLVSALKGDVKIE